MLSDFSSRKTVLIVAVVFTLSVVGVVGLACAPEEEVVDDEEVDVEEDRYGGRLVFGDPYLPESLHPMFGTEQGGVNVMHQMFDSLYEWDEDLGYTPRLAKDHENPDDVTWIFHLRDDIYWHDGNEVFPEGESRKVTAHDVVWNYERIMDPDTGSPRRAALATVEEVEALDDHTLKIVTEAPDPFLLCDVAVMIKIIPPEAIEEMGDEDFGMQPIGSGPFKLVEYVPDSHTLLERNENYPIKPYLDEIRIDYIPDEDVLLMALESGDVDVVHKVPAKEVPRIVEDPELEAKPFSMWIYRFAAFNLEREMFAEREVRRALEMAVDFPALVSSIFPGEAEGLAGRVTYGPLMPGWFEDPKLEELRPDYDPEKAGEILEDHGWVLNEETGVRERDGEPFEFTYQAPAADPQRVRAGIIVSEYWDEIGVDAEMQQVEWGTMLSNARAGEFDVYSSGGPDRRGGIYSVWHSQFIGNGNAIGYANPEVDELLDKGRSTVDLDEWEEHFKEAQRIIVKDTGHLHLYHERWVAAHHDYVKDLGLSGFYVNFTSQANNIWLDK